MHKYVLWFGLFVEFACTPTIYTTTKLILFIDV